MNTAQLLLDFTCIAEFVVKKKPTDLESFKRARFNLLRSAKLIHGHVIVDTQDAQLITLETHDGQKHRALDCIHTEMLDTSGITLPNGVFMSGAECGRYISALKLAHIVRYMKNLLTDTNIAAKMETEQINLLVITCRRWVNRL